MSEEPNVSSPLLADEQAVSSYAAAAAKSAENSITIEFEPDNSTAFVGNVDDTERIRNYGDTQISLTGGSSPSRNSRTARHQNRSLNRIGQTIDTGSQAQISASLLAARRKRKAKKKRSGILLNYDSAMELEYQVQVNLLKHNLASIYFRSRQFWLFTITQGLLTMVASVLAFIASSALIKEVTKDIIATIVGSTSGVVVFLQTMSGVCDYGTRAAMHSSAAIDLRDLRDEIVLIKFKVKKEEEQGIGQDRGGEASTKGSIAHTAFNDDSDDDSSVDEAGQKKIEEHDNTFARIQQRYRQSLSGCKSNFPMALSEAFHGMHSNLLVSESLDNGTYMRDIYGPKKHYKNIMYFKAFDILSSEILNHTAFPLFLPNSQNVVNRAMSHLNTELDKYHKYWDHRLDEARADAIEEAKEDLENEDLLPENLRKSTSRKLAEESEQRLRWH